LPCGRSPPRSHGTALPARRPVDGNWAESSNIIRAFRRLPLLAETPWAWGTPVLTNLVYPTILRAAIRLTTLLPLISTRVATLFPRYRLRRRLPLVAGIFHLTPPITSRAFHRQQGRFIARTSWAMRAAIPSTDLNS